MLDKKVEELEQQLGQAKEARRRNSLKLESAVGKQEAGPLGTYGYGSYG